jgi:dipeptidyl-peptidase-4
VYGGPATNGARETFTTPHAYTEFGFLYVTLDTRSAAGRGKRFLDAIYMKLGVPEIDDMAAASRELARRPYVDGDRVGIYGTSYGGYAAALALLRHPDAFAVASASSPVSSWYHYDTIYTERYMWTPQGNPEGYAMGDAMQYAKDLDGRLMLYYGTADDNVHPSNMMQLIQALQQAGKSFEVQVGPDRGHSGLNPDRMMEFFIENLVMQPLRHRGHGIPRGRGCASTWEAHLPGCECHLPPPDSCWSSPSCRSPARSPSGPMPPLIPRSTARWPTSSPG